MAKEDSVKWSEVEKILQKAEKKELIDLIRDLYKRSADDRRFITARFAKAEESSKILEAYRKKVINVYFHPRGAASSLVIRWQKKLSMIILRLPEILRGQWTWHLPLWKT